MRRRLDVVWADVAIIGALCVAGAGFRAPGLTSRDLWFDDAWAALSSRVGLGDAIHMVATTPLYALGLRWWILASPRSTWWAQLPAFVLGVAGIAAVWSLIRSLGFSRLAAFASAAIVAAGPITVMYSTRVKEYSADLLLACLVLWIFERWRRAPSRGAAVTLALSSIGALWVSASTAAVVGGAVAGALAVAWARRELVGQVAVVAGAIAVGAALEWLAFLRHLPGQLRTNWKTHGFLFSYTSPHRVAFTFQQTFAGISHGLVGLPIPFTFQGTSLRSAPMALSVLTLGVLVVLVGPPLVGVARSRGAAVDATVASAAAVVLAVLGTLSGLVPLGDGRTDEALYPAVLVLATCAAMRLWSRTNGERLHRSVRMGVAAAIAAGALAFGVLHAAQYPPTGLRTVMAQLRPVLQPGDVIVVDGYESFTWGMEDQGRWAVSFRQGFVPWPMGFHVASLDPSVVLSRNYLQPDAAIAGLSKLTHRVWFVGPTVGGFSMAAPRSLWIFAFPSPTLLELRRLGWHDRRVCCHSSGTYAELLTHAR